MKTLSAIIIITFFSAAAFAQAGQIDSTFGDSGLVLTNLGFDNAYSNSILIQPDHKIIVGASVYSDFFDSTGTALLRLTETGQPDSSFGTNGIAITNFAYSTIWIDRFALQPDGKIVGTGGYGVGSFYTIRFNSNGSLDSTFGDNGSVITPLSSTSAGARSIAIQDDGKILTAGLGETDSSMNMVMIRYLINGTLDSTFGIEGIISLNNGGDEANQVILQPDGKIIEAGRKGLYRFNIDGTPDNSFGIAGKAVAVDNASAVALASDGSIFSTAGYGGYYQHDGTLVSKTNPDGIPEYSFGDNGTAYFDTTLYVIPGTALSIQPDGKILLIRILSLAQILRINIDGSIDSSFGVNGIVDLNAGNGNESAADLKLQTDGKIVITGYTGTYPYSSMWVIRLITDLEIGITDFIFDSSALIYPNPLHQTETLEYTLTKNESLTIALYDANGKRIRNFIANEPRTAGEHKETLNIGKLPSGNYFLTLSNGSQKITVRMVKQ